ncbi:MAG TPA: DUF3311 domain-containing protein [Streptosporangiaceae bacterium]|jgi:hypothetical protein
MTQPSRSGRHPVITWGVVAVLLAVGVAGTLVVPLYARTAPKLGPFPFFYWYQLAWIPIVAILAFAAYLLTSRTSRTSRGAHRGQRRRDE